MEILIKFIFRNITAFLKILTLPIIVFGVHVLLSKIVDMYALFPWIDIPMHFVGGMTMTTTLIMLYKALQHINLIPQMHAAITRVFLFTTISTITIFWEFAEFSTDVFFGTHAQVSIPDTMKDMFLGMLGGLLVISLFRIFPIIKFKDGKKS